VRYHNLNDGDVVSLGQHELLYVDERPRLRNGSDEHGATAVISDQTLETHT
jgi:hypothetical protein